MKASCCHLFFEHKRALATVTAGLLVASCLAVGCSPKISTVNGKPDHYYGKELSLRGRVGEIIVSSDAGNVRLFHLVSKGHRIMVFASESLACNIGDQVSVRGEFVEELELAGQRYYDVVSATAVTKPGIRSRIPFF